LKEYEAGGGEGGEQVEPKVGREKRKGICPESPEGEGLPFKKEIEGTGGKAKKAESAAWKKAMAERRLSRKWKKLIDKGKKKKGQSRSKGRTQALFCKESRKSDA